MTAGWAVLGAGSIARRFVSQLPSSGGRLVAAASSDPGRAQALADFAAEYGSPTARPCTYAEALADPRVDAVYVAVLHTGHARLVLDALAAGKRVLCEKPMSPNAGTTMALAEAAQEAGGTLIEAFMYRFHPQTRAVLDLVADGTIGDVVHVDASFSFRNPTRTGRLYDAAVAGGGILDVGCYPMSMARAIAGAVVGRAHAEPTELTGAGAIGPTGVDEWATAELRFASGLTATLRCGINLDDPVEVTVTGSRGRVRIADPWTLEPSQRIEIHVVGEAPRTIDFDGVQPYGLEAAATIAATEEETAATLEDSLGTARALDDWRRAIGLVYPWEADDADIPPVGGRTLAVRPDTTMPYSTIDGLGKRMSRLVMGCDNQPDLAHASALFDSFVEHGGNAFDTAWMYGDDGEYERRLGRWMANRGIRDDLVVIVKGAHTPHCDPESLSRQLLESLDRQGLEYADVYLMHRDNPAVPVGEFVDVLDEHARAGRIRVFGGSNWSPARFDEACRWAAANGRRGFGVLSDHFGLAEAYDVPWAGCVAVTDPASKAWLEERKVPLLPWSSQARGFFARARPDDTTDAELVRCYYSDANFERLRRATELGRQFGVPATAIALAYVIAQSFPTFPLFGPRSLAEARTSMSGLGITLDPQQTAWLDLR